VRVGARKQDFNLMICKHKSNLIDYWGEKRARCTSQLRLSNNDLSVFHRFFLSYDMK
jgi:hypothetical protein